MIALFFRGRHGFGCGEMPCVWRLLLALTLTGAGLGWVGVKGVGGCQGRGLLMRKQNIINEDKRGQ